MKTQKKIFVSFLIAVMTSLTLGFAVFGGEFFPFSSYSMYSGSFKKTARWYTLEGLVDNNGQEQTFNFDRREFLYPFRPQEFSEAIESRIRHGQMQSVIPGVQGLVKNYNRRQALALHQGPTLHRYRLVVHRVTYGGEQGASHDEQTMFEGTL